MTRLVLILWLAAAACARFAPLEQDKVFRLSLRSRDGSRTVCGNDLGPAIVAEALYRDGTRRDSWNGEGSRRGKLHLADLLVTASAGTIDGVGRVHFPRDRVDWIDREVMVRVRLPDRPIAASLALTPRFDCGGLADYRGASGVDGAGGHGQPGPALEVSLARIQTTLNGRLILVRVIRRGTDDRPDYHVIDRRGPTARFTVSAAGGDGGAGGTGSTGWSGSDGSDGANGSSGAPCQDGGRGGDGSDGSDGQAGGHGGDGGRGGEGGTIAVHHAPGDADLVGQIDFSVAGGSGGDGGAGGPGGAGGDGGSGGSGGSAGASTDAGGQHCTAFSGPAGSDGRDGSNGPAGLSGRPGTQGARGSVQAGAIDGARLWRRELAAGVPIVMP